MRAETSPYRLVIGDEVRITYPGSASPVVAMIDMDGNIRLPGLRGVSIAAKSLDEAEVFIEQALSEANLYVGPRVSMSVSRYAPVIVAGDVSGPGRFDFLPGMTVSAALGLAGGRSAEGPGTFELTRNEIETRGRLRQSALDIAQGLVRLAGLNAFLDGRDSFTLTDAQIATVPASARDRLPELVAGETVLLQTRLERDREMLRMWAAEIDNMETRAGISGTRLALQNRIVENLESELDNSRALVERGVQTANRLSEIIQRDANARARALEIESAQILLDQSISDATLERFSFQSQQRQEALRERRNLLVSLEKRRLDHQRDLASLAALSQVNPVSVLADDHFVVRFDLISPRPERDTTTPITPATRLLPGDTLIVTVTPATIPTR
ncbi:MAG: polysaccharide biosynthesis/export family protein [Silicimonas sp.]|nr:polysaccharide biosynthesis/export family protein [Silicimonas sp.]